VESIRDFIVRGPGVVGEGAVVAVGLVVCCGESVSN